MSSQLTVVRPQAPSPVVSAEQAEREQLARDLIYRNGSDAQINAVLAICRRYQWDPLLKPVAIINNQMYVTVAALLQVAHSSGQLDGFQTVSEQQGPDGKWVATATVHRKDFSRPIVVVARQAEYDKGTPIWKSSPATMTETRALARALRYAFPIGLTAAEEVGYDAESGEAVVITAETRATAIDVRAAEADPERPAAERAISPEPVKDWTGLWSWARERGYKTREDLDRAAGRATYDLRPAEIHALLTAKEAEGTIGLQEEPPATPAPAPTAAPQGPTKPARQPTEDDARAFMLDATLPDERRQGAARWWFGRATDETSLTERYAEVAQALGEEIAGRLYWARADELGIAPPPDDPPTGPAPAKDEPGADAVEAPTGADRPATKPQVAQILALAAPVAPEETTAEAWLASEFGVANLEALTRAEANDLERRVHGLRDMLDRALAPAQGARA